MGGEWPGLCLLEAYGFSPDAPILSSAPTDVGHVRRGGNPFDSVLAARPDLCGLK